MGDTDIKDLLSYYMGKNTPMRQKFIIENLRVEKEEIDSESEREVMGVEEAPEVVEA